MQTNDHKIRDYDIILDTEFGKPGTAEREKAIEDALNDAERTIDTGVAKVKKKKFL